jgi:cytochrome c peroxidase
MRRRAKFTPLEAQGLALFNGRAGCFVCHPSTPVGNQPAALFTNFTYHNLGVPKNWLNLFLYMPPDLNPDGSSFRDAGLGETVAEFFPAGAMWEVGKFKTPTLRNVALTAPYGHNGFFLTLKEIVHFYNTRDVPSEGWPAAEFFENRNARIGNLGLTDQEEDAIVAFMMTLTDQ